MTERNETPQQYADRIGAWMDDHPNEIHPERIDRFTWDDENPGEWITPPQCSICARLRDREMWRCSAFPAGIPAAILAGEFDHTKPYLGDNGLRFTPKL
jgi:hypothetical protein